MLIQLSGVYEDNEAGSSTSSQPIFIARFLCVLQILQEKAGRIKILEQEKALLVQQMFKFKGMPVPQIAQNDSSIFI